jgi:hypothetical protein
VGSRQWAGGRRREAADIVKRALVLVVVNVAVFCVLAELLALGIFYYEHGWLFYLDPYRPTLAPIQEGSGDALTAVGLHPYFGPTHRPGIPFDLPGELRTAQTDSAVATNNFGFPSRVNYPFTKTNDREFVIGIFGGSVGAFFCRIGAARLEQDLRKNPLFGDRELVTLCFSHEGYKQPQQLLVLSYFLSIGQPFDMVINIDGFNEVALGRINDQYGWDISMPSHEHLDALVNLINQGTLTPAKVESLARIVQYRRRLNEVAERSNRTHLAAVEFVLRHYHDLLRRRYEEERVRFERLPSNPPANSAIHVTPKVKARSGDAVYEDIAANWRRSSMLMRHLLESHGATYIHVLQPNQYYSTRAFTNDEKKVTFNEGSPFKEGAARGYPFLEKSLDPGTLNGVHIFDAAPGPVYVDDCCHYTVAGNQLLADFIAKEVLASHATH